jgi:glycosyltransferase involved in cell wall biosynthesis
MLWREGLRFELHFVGGAGWDMRAYDEAIARARAAGRPGVDHGRLPDAEMWRVCASAAFTVFPSLHEGFGLPVAESLACGTPVVTTAYGSTREIAAGGGCLLVDPRDDASLRSGLRLLLTDPERLEQLRDEARSTTLRTWDEYTDDLWDALVRPSGADRP